MPFQRPFTLNTRATSATDHIVRLTTPYHYLSLQAQLSKIIEQFDSHLSFT